MARRVMAGSGNCSIVSSREDYARLLSLLNKPAKEVLKRIPRDEAARMI
jgi:hypothetical protein